MEATAYSLIADIKQQISFSKWTEQEKADVALGRDEHIERPRVIIKGRVAEVVALINMAQSKTDLATRGTIVFAFPMVEINHLHWKMMSDPNDFGRQSYKDWQDVTAQMDDLLQKNPIK